LADFGHISAPPPSDFDDHAALMISMTELLACSAPTVYQLMRALVDRIAIIAVVRGEEQRRQAITLLTDWGVPAGGIYFVFMPVGTWTRDFAPAFVRCFDGTVMICDAEYRFEGRANEDVVPRALATLLRLPRRRVPLVLEGGNLLSNGWGLALTTSTIVEVNALNGRPYDAAEIRAILDEHYGLSHVVMLEPLMSHRTLHVDMFATFTAPDVVVVASVDAGVDRDGAGVLDHNADLLSRVRTRGRPLRVERMPMPPYDGQACRTYTNVIYANGALLIPHYPNVERRLEQEVGATYARLLPGWQLIPIDCGPIVSAGGALRCLSAHVPAWLDDWFTDAPPVARRARGRSVAQPIALL
jgi:agmatine deiminase